MPSSDIELIITDGGYSVDSSGKINSVYATVKNEGNTDSREYLITFYVDDQLHEEFVDETRAPKSSWTYTSLIEKKPNEIKVCLNPAYEIKKMGNCLILYSETMKKQNFSFRLISEIEVGEWPSGIDINEKTNLVYVANHNSNTISVIDANKNIVVKQFNVDSPSTIDVDSTLNKIFVESSNRVYIIDENYGKITSLKVSGGGIDDLVVDPTTHLVYVASAHIDNIIPVIDGTYNEEIDIINLSISPDNLAINPNTQTIFATSDLYKLLVIKDIETGEEITVSFPGSPTDVAVNPLTNLIYVPFAGDINGVSVINGKTFELEQISLDTYPTSVFVDSKNNMVYVTLQFGNKLVLIDGSTNKIVFSIPIDRGISDVVVNPNTNKIYASASSNSYVLVFDYDLGQDLKNDSRDEKINGCLIATATYGTELAPQVQMLREIRDNAVLATHSGTSFMTAFNQFYYSFSPYVADYERENAIFKEVVKVIITPLLTSLALLQYVDIDTEEEMLSYGIGIILLNVGMYFVAPVVVIHRLKNWSK